MDKLKDKVGTVLAKRFRGATIDLKLVRPGKRIAGSLIWKGFEGKDQFDRQTALRDTIKTELSKDDASRVSFILTLTPWEKEVMSEKNSVGSGSRKSSGK